MELKRALLVTYHCPPSAAGESVRLLAFAYHLPKFGWRPVIVAPPTLPWEPVDPALRVPAPAVVRPVPYPASAPPLLRAVAPWAIWLPRAGRACKRMVRTHRPEVIVTAGPPHTVHLLGLWLKAAYRLPWVAEVGAPWPAAGRSWRDRWSRHVERRVLKMADTVVTTTPDACERLQATYPADAYKVAAVPDGGDGERPTMELAELLYRVIPLRDRSPQVVTARIEMEDMTWPRTDRGVTAPARHAG